MGKIETCTIKIFVCMFLPFYFESTKDDLDQGFPTWGTQEVSK